MNLIEYEIKGLLTVHERHRLDSFEYYRAEWQAGKLIVMKEKNWTVRKSRCDICDVWCKPGAIKFFSRNLGWVHFCDLCLYNVVKGCGDEANGIQPP